MLLEQRNRATFRSEAMPGNEVRTETTIQLWFKYFAPTLKGLEFDKPWRYDPRSCEFGYGICLDYAGWILSAHFNTTWVPDILTFQRHPGKG